MLGSAAQWWENQLTRGARAISAAVGAVRHVLAAPARAPLLRLRLLPAASERLTRKPSGRTHRRRRAPTRAPVAPPTNRARCASPPCSRALQAFEPAREDSAS
jgi:hypothetical protein